jgi:hypothetical protein
MPPFILLVLCVKEEVDAIVGEYRWNWTKEGLRVLFHERTSKRHEAFIVLEWKNPIPRNFYHKLQNDGNIIDYLIVNHPLLASPIEGTPLTPLFKGWINNDVDTGTMGCT